MLSLKLAFRGLWRHKMRTAITIGAVVMGHFLGIVFITMNDGGHELMIELGIRQGRAGHVVVQAEDYQKNRSVELLVTNPQRVRQQVRKALPEAHVALRVFGGGLARTASDSVGIFFAGVEPTQERPVNDIADKIVRGVYLGADRARIEAAERKLEKKDALWCARPTGPDDPPRRPVVVGVQLAKTLDVDVCDKVIIDTQGMGSRESERFLVVGIFEFNSPDLDASFINLRLEDAQRMMHIEQGVHQVAVFLDSLQRTEAAHRTLERAITTPGLRVLSWDEAMPEMAEFIWLDEASGYIFIIIVYLIIGIGILNTILMSVMERTREFGVIRAVGAGPGRIVGLVLMEGALIGLLGVALGSVAAVPMVDYLETTGIDLSSFGESAMEMGGVALSVVKGKLYWSSAIWASVGVFLMAVLAAVYPAIRAARFNVLKAITQV